MLLCSPEGLPQPVDFTSAARPAKLEGLRIGFLDNTKAPVDKIMRHLATRLIELDPAARIFQVSKQHPSLPAEPEMLEQLAANADVVINALGD